MIGLLRLVRQGIGIVTHEVISLLHAFYIPPDPDHEETP